MDRKLLVCEMCIYFTYICTADHCEPSIMRCSTVVPLIRGTRSVRGTNIHITDTNLFPCSVHSYVLTYFPYPSENDVSKIGTEVYFEPCVVVLRR